MMEFEKIMHEITSGLSGDGKKDIKYLMEQAEKYKNHEMGKEIVRAIGRLIFKCAPEDKQAEVNRGIQNDLTSWESVLEEVRFRQHEKRYDEALVLMEDLIRKFEDSHMFTDDQVTEYHCFNEFFEEALYKFRTEPTRELRNASFPLDVFYTQYGSLLLDIKRPEDAENALIKAQRWNPADVKIMFERAETHKIRGDIEGFFRITLDAFKYAIRPKQVARCFRNLGFYFTEKELWEEAVACHTMSLQFDNESSMAMSELYYIQQKAGKTIQPPKMDRFREIGEKYGFPTGADMDILGLSYHYGKAFAENRNTAGARYCWDIFYSLTDDEDIKEQMDKLPPDKE